MAADAKQRDRRRTEPRQQSISTRLLCDNPHDASQKKYLRPKLTMKMRILAIAGLLLGCGHEPSVIAGDWPNFRGPNYDGVSIESDLKVAWKTDGPKKLWSAQVGIGFSAVSVHNGRLVTMGNENDMDTVVCLDATSGAPVWRHAYASDLGPKYYEGGPGSTPTIDGDRVYSLGKWGDFFCLDAASGEVIWKRQLAPEEGLAISDWGFSGSVFVSGDSLILNVGGAGMAFNKKTGKTIWTTDDNESGYSSPYPMGNLMVIGTSTGYSAINSATGEAAWEIDWPTRYGVNAADPIVHDGHILVASGYGKGAGLFKLGEGDPELVWKSRKLRAQQNAPVLINGHLYGFDGDGGSRANLRCLNWKSGEELWATEDLGYGALTAADGKLIAIGAKGDLALIDASPEGYRPIAKAKVMEGKCWTVPVLANGLLYCRTVEGTLSCFDLRAK